MASITQNPTTLQKNRYDPLHRAVDSTYALETTRLIASSNAESSTNDSIWNASPVCISRCMRLKSGLGSAGSAHSNNISLYLRKSCIRKLVVLAQVMLFRNLQESLKSKGNSHQVGEFWLMVEFQTVLHTLEIRQSITAAQSSGRTHPQLSPTYIPWKASLEVNV